MLFGVPGGALSQVSNPISLLYASKHDTGNNSTDGTAYNPAYPSATVSLGSAGTNKLVVIGVSWEGSNNGTSNISSMTLGGNAMTEICTVGEQSTGTYSSLYMYETNATSSSISIVFGGTATYLSYRTGIYIQCLDKASPIILDSYDTQSTAVTGTQVSTSMYLRKGQAIVVNTTGADVVGNEAYNHSELGSGIYEYRYSVGGESSTTQLTHSYINNNSSRNITYTTENMTLSKCLCAAVFR